MERVGRLRLLVHALVRVAVVAILIFFTRKLARWIIPPAPKYNGASIKFDCCPECGESVAPTTSAPAKED